jgi:SAM-dependent methyltransferase
MWPGPTCRLGQCRWELARQARRLDPVAGRVVDSLRHLVRDPLRPAGSHLQPNEALPFPEQTVAAIYAGELWEHFELPDAQRLTNECFRVLQQGGVLRVCVPDGPTIWRRYLAMYEAEMAKPIEHRDAAPLKEYIALYFREICTRRIWGSMGHTHKWQFDDIQLIDVFRRAGFQDVARRDPQNSRIPNIGAVEIRGESFLMVEGVKP